MKKEPTIEELFGRLADNLARFPREETNLEKAIRLAKELAEKLKKI